MSQQTETKTISEAGTKIRTLIERVKFKPGDLLPSQIEGEIQSAIQTAREACGDSPLPTEWNDLVATVRTFLTENAKPRQTGAADHFYREIQEGSVNLVAAEQQQATNENLLSMGQAMKLANFNNLSPAARMAHVKAGKTVLD